MGSQEGEDRKPGTFWSVLAKDPEVLVYAGIALWLVSLGIALVVEAFRG